MYLRFQETYQWWPHSDTDNIAALCLKLHTAYFQAFSFNIVGWRNGKSLASFREFQEQKSYLGLPFWFFWHNVITKVVISYPSFCSMIDTIFSKIFLKCNNKIHVNGPFKGPLSWIILMYFIAFSEKVWKKMYHRAKTLVWI